MKLSELAAAIGAQLENGSPQTEITGVAAIENAAEGQVTFVANPKYGPAAKTTRASAVIVSQGFPAISTATLRTKNPYLAWTKAVGIFYQGPRYAPGIHPSAVIAANAKVGQNAHIGPYVVIEEGVEIGDDAVLLAHVVIYRGVKIGHKFFAHAHAMVRENCELGNSVLLQNGVVIGSDGFGFAKDENNHWHKIMQGGRVVIEDDVEIQANTCIDRASVGETRIGRGSKLDNMVHIGHSCTIGQDSLLCAQVGLAGTTEIGNKAILAGQVGVSGHVKIGDGAVVIAQSGVPQDVPAGAMVSGAPAIDHKLWLRCCAAYPKLPELAKLLRSKS